jgi:ATP-dependent 26S proteasome regulatory subunit
MLLNVLVLGLEKWDFQLWQRCKMSVETVDVQQSVMITTSAQSELFCALLLTLQPEKFVNLGIEPPKGVLLFGPPGTGKTLCARAVANRTDACFIRVIGSELVQKYVGEVRGMI